MEAQTLNCPMCGAPASTESTRCEHCNARLATISCPSCFGLMFQGAKFCSHCGARADRTEVATKTIRTCPRCRVNMQEVVIGKTDLRECPRCEGIWADAAALESICADREQQAAVLGVATTIQPPASVSLEAAKYVPCPVCKQLMNRVNFAHCANVIVDVCKPHGTWFDKDELRRIIEFIRAGGLEKSRAREIAELERQRRELESARTAATRNSGSVYESSEYNSRENALSIAASAILSSFFD